jgi:Do/DeqQ family serine protease
MARRFIVVTLFTTIGFFAGLVLTGRMRTADESLAQPAAARSEAAPQGRPTPGSLPDLTGIAERAVNAVTSISSTQIVRSRPDPFWQFFYPDQMLEQRMQSLGSGVIVSSDGYVVTNNHVVGDARAEVSVILADKRELPAKVIGTDETTDLAVLKITAGNLPTIPWGDSSRLKVAEWVLAIGNPFGVFNQTVTLGIVSATGRNVEGLGYEDFIQTDAAINRGNSGGALINARGELVGINTAIYSETGGYQGIGLAVPGNLVRKTLDQLIKEGVVRRGTIYGILLQHMTSELAERLGAPDARGVLVARVAGSSRAAAAGLDPGDIIVGVNNQPIETASQFLRTIAELPIGSTATLTVIREGKRISVRVPIDLAQQSRRRR